ncbi:anthranilate phosphoribosyltransferase [Niveomyces insectorum RCEF 264]|uniref:Anthranilate phosphoribosyltransferase n=1 Tax=Niveomyces insectorum RCEF 264 TaxID=1081102 RepID=A0A167XWP6_9HYPO|nr:anthranilate phosphoribosyltransferase [Niveomyces insectorum RCEF 264]
MAAQQRAADAAAEAFVDIKPLLNRLWPLPATGAPSADDIADAVALFFTNQVSPVQAGALLMCLHFTGLDRQADVLAACAARMRRAAARVDADALRAVTAAAPGLRRGQYRGGLCDIVGTGGDAHNTFNVSTAASILASAYLRLAKHGNRASTSKSGSADLLAHLPHSGGGGGGGNGPSTHGDTTQRQPGTIENESTDLVANLHYVAPATLPRLYATTNYAFLFAPVFHPGMRHVAPIRRQLPWRTLFNLLGPLANPVDVLEETATGSQKPSPLEARIIGVARRELGPVFAEALRMAGTRKALVVCGAEALDEISIAGPTDCWWLHETADTAAAAGSGVVAVDHFQLTPADFGVAAHPLSAVSPGQSAAANAATMTGILRDERPADDPLLSFVLINTAALLVVSGRCEPDDGGKEDASDVVTERGPGGGRWKEGVRLARAAIRSGEARRQWQRFVEATNELPPAAV